MKPFIFALSLILIPFSASHALSKFATADHIKSHPIEYTVAALATFGGVGGVVYLVYKEHQHSKENKTIISRLNVHDKKLSSGKTASPLGSSIISDEVDRRVDELNEFDRQKKKFYLGTIEDVISEHNSGEFLKRAIQQAREGEFDLFNSLKVVTPEGSVAPVHRLQDSEGFYKWVSESERPWIISGFGSGHTAVLRQNRFFKQWLDSLTDDEIMTIDSSVTKGDLNLLKKAGGISKADGNINLYKLNKNYDNLSLLKRKTNKG